MKPRNLVSSGVAIFDSDNRILLQHRMDSDDWCIPGGVLEVGEDTESCAIREVYEETNLKVWNLELFNVYSGKDMHWTYPDGNEYYFIAIVYISTNYSGKLEADGHESKDVRFFDLNKLPKLASTNINVIYDLKKRMRS